jgi:hypothetical protein
MENAILGNFRYFHHFLLTHYPIYTTLKPFSPFPNLLSQMVKKMLYFSPQHLFLFEKCCLKSDNSFGATRPIQKIHQGVWDWRQPPSSPRKYWTCQRLKWPQVDYKITCNQHWKACDSISIHWEVAALWNQFWWTKWWFLAFLRCLLVTMVTGNLILSML